MVMGPLGKLFAPVGVLVVLVGVVVAGLSFILILLDVTGDFPSRIHDLTGLTALPLVVGGAALTWLGK